MTSILNAPLVLGDWIGCAFGVVGGFDCGLATVRLWFRFGFDCGFTSALTVVSLGSDNNKRSSGFGRLDWVRVVGSWIVKKLFMDDVF